MTEQKSRWFQRTSAVCAWLAVLLLVTTMVSAAAAKKKAAKKKPSRPPAKVPVKSKPIPAYKTKKAVPPGRPFQALQSQIDELEDRLDAGVFDQLRIFNSDATQASVLYFGPLDDRNIRIDPDGGLTGLLLHDPDGIRLLGRNDGGGARLLFGPTDLCTVEVDPQGPAGLLLRDPAGIRIINPDAQRLPILQFGEGGPDGQECSISASPELGMIFVDPRGFLFENDVTVDGNITADNIGVTSSRRLKQDIRPIDDPLDRISRLQGVYFNWKPEKGGQADLGFIAEDVEDVLPEVVTHAADGRTKGVKYGNVVALTVEGLKAQQEQIAQLKAENAALQQQVSQLQASMETLSAQVGRLLNAD